MTASLAASLATARAGGRKAFVPYVTGGLRRVDPDLLRGLADAGADALEVGIPFSDPVMDGPVIQEASGRALAAGASLESVLALVEGAALHIPVAAMTYLNPVLAKGQAAFLAALSSAGVTGAIVPDLPVDEAEAWIEACRSADVAPVFLAAPNSAPDRLAAVAEASRGFVYCVSTLGVTGARRSLAASARPLVEALRSLTDTPLLVGVGVSTPEQAAEACEFADGVVVGSALVKPLLEGDRDGTLRLARALSDAIHAR